MDSNSLRGIVREAHPHIVKYVNLYKTDKITENEMYEEIVKFVDKYIFDNGKINTTKERLMVFGCIRGSIINELKN